MTASRSADRLRDLLRERVLVLDGAMGTMLQQAGLMPVDFGGERHEGCHEQLVHTRPDVVAAVHHAYLASGADIISTNTFGATRLVLAEYGLGNNVRSLNIAAAQLARNAANHWASSQRPRFVAGAVGPTTRSLTVTGGITFTELEEAFFEQASGLVEGGVDLLLLETCQDTRNVKAALRAIARVSERAGHIPLMIAATLEAGDAMLAGQSIEAFCASVDHSADLLSIGLNCSTGPAAMSRPLETLDRTAAVATSCHPNAGLPDDDGQYSEGPAAFAAQMAPLLERGLLNIAGGCCGTTEAHIRALARLASQARPRPLRARPRAACYTGIDLLSVDRVERPIIVGERANVVGSRAFRRLIAARQWDEAADVAREQVRHGAQIIDVCLQSADGDECADIPPFYERLIRAVRAPIMVDTTDVRALDLALTYCQGRSLVNSANLEDGGTRLLQVCQVVKSHGAALVLGCIDNDPVQPQALTRERKLDVARRAFATATADGGLAPSDIIIDPLVFPCATGDPAYIGAAVETMEAIGLIKRELPEAQTVLGISNVSFGLPAAARRVVDSVFLHYCTRRGLDLAIANPTTILPFEAIEARERLLAENLLFNLPDDDCTDAVVRTAPADWRQQAAEQRAAITQHNVSAITSHFRAAVPAAAPEAQPATLDERIAACVVDGTRSGLVDQLERRRAEGVEPLAIINGPLMAGMNEVAIRFKDNRMIVAEVLRSAEVMRAAVRHLEQFIDPADVASRGTVLLATVKGDVHDIGKDLVKIILGNNGYTVVDLGTRVDPETVIRACRQHRPTAIGLSGLLVKSAHQMIATAAALRDAGIRTPLVVGGAALTEQFTRTRIAPAYEGPVTYASDAMAGLTTLNELLLRPPTGEPIPPTPADRQMWDAAPPRAFRRRRPPMPAPGTIPSAPYLQRRRDDPPVVEVWRYLNPFMLYNRHLGFKGDMARSTGDGDPRAIELTAMVESLQREVEPLIRPRAVWQFFAAERDGETLHLFDAESDAPAHSFTFERQPGDAAACLTDYVLDARDGRRDHVVLFVATAGAGVRDRARDWMEKGEFLKAHALQALALETAEACAEWLHRRVRHDWGFPDPAALTVKELFTSKYRGKRYSFGYPACPNLDDQRGIWKLLAPDDIGVTLTEGMMMEPEASVSGLVFHHPDCEYFAVCAGEEGQNRG